ncbi:MAG TPA: hypothetical protein VF297_28555 [Pyrinomonadaceae bacterium]
MIPTLPNQVVTEMARHHHRFHHYLWHRVRNAWPRLNEDDRRAVRAVNSGWEPPRPAMDAARRPLRDNDSGEDFLFMHRRMIVAVNAILSAVNDPDCQRVEGWRRVPPPGDGDYPVPDFPGSGLEEVKSVEYFEQFIAPWERQYTDPDYLRGVTLGQLGSDIEFTIHDDMHMRWAAPSPVGYRPNTAIAHRIGAQWDAPAYNYLGDTYSSHVNPIFWKLHGWVDDRIEDWKRANGVTGDIPWKGTWLGPADDPHAPHHAAKTRLPCTDANDELQQIDQIISESGANDFDGFFRPTTRPRG